MQQWTLPDVDSVLPSVDEFVDGHNRWPLLPLPMPEPIKWKRVRSCRLRLRQKRRLQISRMLRGVVTTINALAMGQVARLTTPYADAGCRMKASAARSLALSQLRQKVVEVARARRGLGLTGVRDAAAILLKTSPDADGYVRAQKVRQVSMLADKMVEPPVSSSIDMLEVLPEEDSKFYSCEEHVVETEGKSEVIFQEIEEHYGFVGGTLEEYLKYLSRPDVESLWQWDLTVNIKATAGISCVLKKNGVDQRKLIMQCAANYMFADPTTRADLGMGGGAAIGRCFVEADAVSVSACDEDSAFTHVRVPGWMTYWQAGPPVRAELAWHLLSPEIKAQIDQPHSTFVSPRYLRLAMGGSHSVYILMRINLHQVGKSLFSYAGRLLNSVIDEDGQDDCNVSQVVDNAEDEEPDLGLRDEEWELRQQARRMSEASDSVFTVQGWCDAVRRSKQEDERVFVVVHMFAGERREDDVQQFLEEKMYGAHMKLLMLSVDLAEDPLWDFRNPNTFQAMMELAEEGLIDVWLGGPPCSTVARSRHVRLHNGPRPLRFRWALWGRHDLRSFERERVEEANDLWVNFWTMCEAVSMRGGCYLMEHPADPGTDPYPSMWLIPELLEMEKRSRGRRAHFHQCPFGGISPKLTTFSSNVVGLERIDGVRCPGLSSSHTHGKTIGRAPDGSFYTRRLQTYPAGLCQMIAEMIFDSLLEMKQKMTGPTGALHQPGELSAPRITAWSRWASGNRSGVVMLNESYSRCQKLIINDTQSAAYIHVDDTVFLSTAKHSELHSDVLMERAVNSLEDVGFGVTQQMKSTEVEKVVGYEVVSKPPQFRLPLRKMALLNIALMELTSQQIVVIDTLRSLVGMWIFGSLLRRELLSIPHALFHFMEENDEATVKWWFSARDEVRAMARMTSLMICDLGSPILPILFGTDAMGENNIDYGGYGIVATELGHEEKKVLLKLGELPGRSIARLDGCQGTRFPDRPLKPTVPFTRLPDEFFRPDRWKAVQRGRWRYGDHITIGESRTVVKLLERLASWPSIHGCAVFSIQDNQPTACAMAKGRSPSFALNRVLRQRAALCLSSGLKLYLPWAESAKQPADELSRIQ